MRLEVRRVAGVGTCSTDFVRRVYAKLSLNASRRSSVAVSKRVVMTSLVHEHTEVKQCGKPFPRRYFQSRGMQHQEVRLNTAVMYVHVAGSGVPRS